MNTEELKRAQAKKTLGMRLSEREEAILVLYGDNKEEEASK